MPRPRFPGAVRGGAARAHVIDRPRELCGHELQLQALLGIDREDRARALERRPDLDAIVGGERGLEHVRVEHARRGVAVVGARDPQRRHGIRDLECHAEDEHQERRRRARGKRRTANATPPIATTSPTGQREPPARAKRLGEVRERFRDVDLPQLVSEQERVVRHREHEPAPAACPRARPGAPARARARVAPPPGTRPRPAARRTRGT